MTWKSAAQAGVCCLLLSMLSTLAMAQDGGKVDQLEKRVADLESQLKELRSLQQQGQEETDVSFDEIDQQLLDLAGNTSGLKTGSRDFVITGNAFGGFTTSEGSDSTFSNTLEPIFLWKLGDRVFMEGEVELEFGSTATETNLEYAQMSYVLNDSMTLGFGRFLSPANVFAERLHPAWINKLPDKVLGLGSRRIIPFSQTGVQLHGATPVGDQKIDYAIYVSNGPSLNLGKSNYGSLSDKNFADVNNGKAVGGRIGYFPIPELEVGYSFERSSVTPSGSAVASADATIQSADLGYVTDAGPGTLDVRAQWATSHVDNVVFDPLSAATPPFGPVSVPSNRRNAGYVQVAYRPSEVESEVLSKLEGVARYDMIDLPSTAPEGTDEQRLTLGLNYWQSASTVFKLAYQKDNKDAPSMDSDALMFQWAVGL